MRAHILLAVLGGVCVAVFTLTFLVLVDICHDLIQLKYTSFIVQEHHSACNILSGHYNTYIEEEPSIKI